MLEESSLLIRIDNRDENELVLVKNDRSRRSLILVTSLIALFGFVSFSATLSPSIAFDVPLNNMTEMKSSSEGNWSLIAFNDDYDRWNDMADLYGWDFVAEPFRITHFKVLLASSPVISDNAPLSHVNVYWKIETSDSKGSGMMTVLSSTTNDLNIESATGAFSSKVAYSCEKAGRKLTVTTQIGACVHVSTGVCKYIRREIRSMNTNDREAYFSALGELHRLTTAEGQKIYGEDFRGVDEMNKQHMTFPDFTDGCTSMHNYMSFLSGHTSLWRQTENQLQIINPKIAAPYWDLTIDALRTSGMQLNNEISGAWQNEIMFSDEWFGSIIKNDLHTSNSKWFKNSIRPRDTTYAERSSFGYTGMVFNNDDSQFVTRADRNCNYRKSNWQIQGGSPTCTVVERCFGYASLKSMATCLAGSYHQFHYPMGGIFDCAYSFEDIIAAAEKDSSGWYATHESMFDDMVHTMYYNYMDWGEKGMLSKPESCSPGIDKFDDCRAVRTGYEKFVDADKDTLIQGIVQLFGTGDSRDPSSEWTDDDKSELKVALTKVSMTTVRMLADTLFKLGKSSSFMQPYSASIEPFFWSVHENLERFWLYAALHSGNRDGSIIHENGDKGHVIDDPKYTYAPKYFQWEWARTEEWASTSSRGEFSENTAKMCYGHNLNDTLSMPKETGTRPFNDRAFGLTGHPGAYTNQELMKLFWPTSVENPYVYDSLIFKECTAHGESVDYKPDAGIWNGDAGAGVTIE